MRNDQAKALVDEISKGTEMHLLMKTEKGRYGGTYACKELVIAYAAWISAAFHLKVIRVFLNVMAPATAPRNPAIDYDRISPAQAQDLKQIVEAIVKAGVQGFPDTWARLHRKFQVNSYLELPATRHLDARNYLIAKLPASQPNGVVDEPPESLTINDQVERLIHQLNAGNGVPVEVFMPLYDAVTRKMQERGWFRLNTLMPEVQMQMVFSPLNRLARLFHPLSEQATDVVHVMRALRGLDPKDGMRRNDFYTLADERALMMH